MDQKQASWIAAHIHMYEYFGGVAKILVPDNCKTAVIHNGKRKDQQINQTYQELAEHYGTAIIPARVRSPKDKPNEIYLRGSQQHFAMNSSFHLRN